MRVYTRFLSFFLFVLFVSSSCFANDKTAKVVGIGECADCKENNIETSQAFSGLHVTIDCMLKTGEIKTRASAELDANGKFEASVPSEILEGQKLKDECYAQLHSAYSAPCPAYNGLESSKIIFKSAADEDGKVLTFGPNQNLKFASALCASAFHWPFYKHPKPHPKFHHPWFNHPPLPSFHHVYKKPLPPYKKPLPPVTIHKHPEYKKPVPPFPFHPKPPIPFKKPCPPLPKLPPFPKVTPHAPIAFPPLPPHFNHP